MRQVRVILSKGILCYPKNVVNKVGKGYDYSMKGSKEKAKLNKDVMHCD